jgi:hypothetical protein
MTKRGKKRFNTYFRQTAKAFRAARQTQIYAHLKRNLPYRIFNISKTQFLNKLKKVNIAKRKRLTLLGKHSLKMRKGKVSVKAQKPNSLQK